MPILSNINVVADCEYTLHLKMVDNKEPLGEEKVESKKAAKKDAKKAEKAAKKAEHRGSKPQNEVATEEGKLMLSSVFHYS